MSTKIITKNSQTTTSVPTTSDVDVGELAVNTADKRVFTNDGTSVVELGTTPSSLAVTGNTTVGGTLGVTGNVDINGGNIDGTTIGSTTAAAGSFTTVSATGNITVGGTVDGRDVATDGTKLDGIEAGADVTDTANVTAAGALMDSELTNITAVKALNQGVATTDSPTFAGLTTSADINFGDNDKAIFGAGSDLQIYHDGNSWIRDTGVGNLRISASNYIQLQNDAGTQTMALFNDNGNVSLRYAGAEKLATTYTGIDVTGTATMDGLTVENTSGDTTTLVRAAGGADNDAILDLTARGSGGQYRNTNIVSVGANSATAQLQFKVDNSLGNLQEVLRLDGSGDISFYEDTGTTAKFYWDASAESLGIGTSSPSGYGASYKQVVIDGGANPSMLQLNNTTTGSGSNTGGLAIVQSGVDAYLINPQATGTTHFFTNNTERMRIDSSGNLLVGKTYSNHTVVGIELLNYGEIRGVANSSYAGLFNRLTSAGEVVRFYNGTTNSGNISVNGSTTSYNTSSDYRLKEDWQPMVDASTRVEALKPVNFAWKASGDRVDGFLAHELAEVIPEAVTGEKDAVDDEGNPVYQGIDQSKIVPLLTAALQEALVEIKDLKARLDAAGL